MKTQHLAALATLSLPFALLAQPTQTIAEIEPANIEVRKLEISAGSQGLSNGYGRWYDLNLRGAYGLGSHLLQGELSAHRRFGQNGNYLGLSDTYTFNPDWYGSLSVGAGDGAFYLPNYRVDATLYRKWLQERNLVTSVGLGYYDAPDGHTDRSLSLGAAYYFSSPWIVEAGVRLNSSNPGAIKTSQQFVALTWGRSRQDVVSARYGWGGEGYLTTAANTQLVNFRSREASLSWRHWLTPSTGVLIGINRYTNPSYRRNGVQLGLFHDF